MEHLHHFGLPQDPFSNEPDLRFYFESGAHRDAQRRVERGVRQHKGLTLLTGDGGMGKTLLARRILEGLEEEVFEATLLVMLPGAADATGILQRFARQLGCENPASDRAGLLGQLYEQLAIVREDGRHAVLIIDDAQIMTPEVFAELGGLLNLEYEDRRLVSMLFVGSPELDRLVQNDASIMPRIDVRVRLQPLDMANATAYLKHRLAAVRGNPEVLPPNAIDSLFKFGRGRPRLLNTLADNALFEAYLAGRPAMEPRDVERAAADLGIGPDPGTTYSHVTSATAPTVLAVTGSVFASAGASPMPASITEIEVGAALDLDDGVAEFELAPNVDGTAFGRATLDLDAGLEDAMEDLRGRSGSAVTPRVEDFELATDRLELELEPSAMAEESEPAFLEFMEAEPVLETEAFVLDGLEDGLLDGLSAEPFELGEAEMTPMEMSDMDPLEDAFVVLLDE